MSALLKKDAQREANADVLDLPPLPVNQSASTDLAVSTIAEIEQRFGIQIARVMVTGQGSLVHLRFRVTDAAKAMLLLQPENLPVLVAEDRDTVVIGFPTWPEWDVPRAGSSYCLLYSNTRKVVRAGQPVGIIVGGLFLELVAV